MQQKLTDTNLVAFSQNTVYFWLRDLEPNTEYFIQVQAYTKFGRQKLAGEKASMFFKTPNHKHGTGISLYRKTFHILQCSPDSKAIVLLILLCVLFTIAVPKTPRSSVETNTTMTNVKYRKKIKNLVVDKLFWVHEQLLAHISWNAVKNAQTNYSITWSDNGCHDEGKAWYIAKTDVSML